MNELYVYNGILVRKKEGNIAICKDVDAARGYHAKQSKSVKDDKHHMISSYGEFRSRGRGKRARNHKKNPKVGDQSEGCWRAGVWGMQ